MTVIQNTDVYQLLDDLVKALTDPNSIDTDSDGIIDPFETGIYLDNPEVSRYAEFTRLIFGTDVTEFYADDDGLPDGYLNGYGEFISDTDPLDNDTDDDGLLDSTEVFG